MSEDMDNYIIAFTIIALTLYVALIAYLEV